jgi:hypothetical protein
MPPSARELTYFLFFYLGQTKLICCCSDFLNKKVERAIEKKKEKKAIKWEWLETTIELTTWFWS